MGQGQSPTFDELIFIYSLLAKGYSDTEIITKFRELGENGQLGSLRLREDVRFIRQRRKEYEAAKKVIESHPSTLSDPIAIKAREKHLDEIGALIERIKNVKLPRASEVKKADFGDDWKSAAIENIEEEALFSCLKKHITDAEFWDTYLAWHNCIDLYFQSVYELGSIVRMYASEVECWPNVVAVNEEFYKPIEQKVSEYFNNLNFQFSQNNPNDEGIAYEVLLVDNIEVLTTTPGATNCSVLYDDMAKQIFSSNEFLKARKYYNQSYKHKADLDKLLNAILLSRSYIKYICELCPQ